MSAYVSVTNGVRHGGILSTWPFNVYIDYLSRLLRDLAAGCLHCPADVSIICRMLTTCVYSVHQHQDCKHMLLYVLLLLSSTILYLKKYLT